MRCWWALAFCLFLSSLPALAQTQTLEELEAQLQTLETKRSDAERRLQEKRRIIAGNEDFLRERRAMIRDAGEGMGGALVKGTNQPMIDATARVNAQLAEDVQFIEVWLNSLDRQLEIQKRKIADFREEERRKEEMAALEARLKAENAARLEAERAAEAKRLADAQRLAAEKAAAEKAAEERRLAREQAQEQRQWKLLYLVGGVTVLLFGVFIALRAVGVSASLSEWGRFYFWLVKAAVVVSFALFLLTAVETVFGALSIPDWMRRPLADLLDKASDAIDPEAQGVPK